MVVYGDKRRQATTDCSGETTEWDSTCSDTMFKSWTTLLKCLSKFSLSKFQYFFFYQQISIYIQDKSLKFWTSLHERGKRLYSLGPKLCQLLLALDDKGKWQALYRKHILIFTLTPKDLLELYHKKLCSNVLRSPHSPGPNSLLNQQFSTNPTLLSSYNSCHPSSSVLKMTLKYFG